MAFIIKTNEPSAEQFYPLVAIREGVIFPHTESVLTFGRPKSVNAVTAAFKGDKQIVLVAQKEARIHDPKPNDLFGVGTLAVIERTLKTDTELNALVRGVKRVRIQEVTDQLPFMVARVGEIPR